MPAPDKSVPSPLFLLQPQPSPGHWLRDGYEMPVKSKYFFLEESETTSGIKRFIVLKNPNSFFFFFYLSHPFCFSRLSFPRFLAFQQAVGQCALLRAMLKEGKLFLWKFPEHWSTYWQPNHPTGVLFRTNGLLILYPSLLPFVVM